MKACIVDFRNDLGRVPAMTNGHVFKVGDIDVLDVRLIGTYRIGCVISVDARLIVRADAVDLSPTMGPGKEVNIMDPETQSEQMEDVRPSDRGFISDDVTDAEAREALEQGDESEEDCN